MLGFKELVRKWRAPQQDEVEAVYGKVSWDHAPSAEALAKAILARQLATGEATVAWQDRVSSRAPRVKAARVIIAGTEQGMAAQDMTDAVAAVTGMPVAEAARVVEHALDELVALAAA